jgi:uncharacterized membrane protein
MAPMKLRRRLLMTGAVVLFAVRLKWPDSLTTRAVLYGLTALIVFDLILTLRTGYQRRRPHWTSASWRRFLVLMSIPAGAIAFVFFVAIGVDFGWPIVGEGGSTVRVFWVAGSVLALFAAVGLPIGIDWLADGAPERQLEWPSWVR